MSELLKTNLNLLKYSNLNLKLIGDHISLTKANNTSSNININNTFEVSYTGDLKNFNNVNNASIRLLDRSDSIFKTLYLESNDLYLVPRDVIDSDTIEDKTPVKLIREDDLETILNSNTNPIIYSNLIVDDPGSIRFIRRDSNGDVITDTLATTLIGFRQNNGIIQFRNQTYTEWTDLSNTGVGGGASTFYELIDVKFSKDEANAGDYIKLDGNKDLVNTPLNIVDDTTPQLGGNLYMNTSNIIFDTDGGLIDITGNLSIKISNDSSNSNPNYLEIKKGKNTGDEDIIELRSESTNGANANFKISTRGSGDLDINLIEDSSTKGDLIVRANEFNLADIDSFNMSTGKFIGSLNLVVLSLTTAGNTEGTSKQVNTSTETIVLQNNDDSTNYYIYLDTGINGQKLNIIYETTENNNSVTVLFKDGIDSRFIGTGSGLGNKLIFTTSGQSACLQYLEMYSSGPNISRNRWQILNTGCFVE